MIRQITIKIRNKGQITLPVEIRKMWNLKSNDELILIIKEKECILMPKRYAKVSDIAGKLGPADDDEIEFAILDPELIPEYYHKKYGEPDENK